MKTIKKLGDLPTTGQLRDFLSGIQAVAFSVLGDKDASYRWIQGELDRFRHLSSARPDKGVVIRYLMKMSGYSRPQITRLVTQYRDTGQMKRRQRTVAGFVSRCTTEDIRLLSAMDDRHETPSGQAAKKGLFESRNGFQA